MFTLNEEDEETRYNDELTFIEISRKLLRNWKENGQFLTVNTKANIKNMKLPKIPRT